MGILPFICLDFSWPDSVLTRQRKRRIIVHSRKSTNLIQAVCPSLEESDDLVQLMLHQVQIFSYFFLKRNVKINLKRKVKIISRSESESNFSKENWKLFLKRKVKVIVQTKSESYFWKRKCNLFLKRKVKVISLKKSESFFPTQVAEIHTEATHIHIGCDEVNTFV